MAQHALFADMAGKLFHSRSSPLPSDLICLAAPIGFHGQARQGNAGCQGPPQAHRSGAKARQETRNQERQRIFSPNVMSSTFRGPPISPGATTYLPFDLGSTPIC